jgi:subtilisin family serine protease
MRWYNSQPPEPMCLRQVAWTFSFQIGGARFARSDGTSFAAPLVTGSAALLKAIDPTLTPAQLKQRLLDSAFAVNTTDALGETQMAYAQSRLCRAPVAGR